MALTQQQKEEVAAKVVSALDEMDEQQQEKVLADETAFASWLEKVLYEIWLKIRNAIRNFWNWLRSRF